MKNKCLIFLGILSCLFLTGCEDVVSYDPDLFKPDESSCWPCQMYTQAFQALSNAIESSLGLMCSNSKLLLSIGLLFWLGFKVLPWLISFSPPKFKDDFVEVIKVCFKASIVAIFLTNTQLIYDFLGKSILQPIGGLFLYLSEVVLISPSSVGVSMSSYTPSDSSLANLLGFNKLMEAISDQLSVFENSFSQAILPNGTKISMEPDKMFGKIPMQIQSIIWQIYSALWSGMGLVFQLIQSGYLMGFIAALFLGYALFALLIALPLSFVDAIVRLGMGIILLPLFMLTWVFPIKIFEGVSKKLLELTFSAFFDILFNSIYVAFLVSVLRVYVQEKIPHMFSTDFQASESSLRQSGERLTTDFLILVVLVMTIYKLAQKVDEMSGTFFDGAGKGTSIYKTMGKIKDLALVTGAALVRASMGDLSGFKKVGDKAMDMAKEGMNEMGQDQKKDDWV